MVSVSINQKPIASWPPTWRPLAERLARKVLEGAGVQSTDTFEWGRMLTLTLRRQCSDIERRRVMERYLSV